MPPRYTYVPPGCVNTHAAARRRRFAARRLRPRVQNSVRTACRLRMVVGAALAAGGARARAYMLVALPDARPSQCDSQVEQHARQASKCSKLEDRA
eukprot:COSAG02_NODE_908_length_16032_cov_53.699931_12_plen_96_part_00